MFSDDIVIRVANLSKRYEIYDTPRDRLKQFVLPRLTRLAGKVPGHYFREFWALKDVSFEIKKGETLGIIGRNGSGKSTLLQIICGTSAPSEGTIEINGRVAALLELGAGFNPEFTGRENVYLNGSLLGLSRDEIDSRFDSISAFAEIGAFIEQPVKTYSSGMYVRLAFAVIAHVDAEILVIDEALAVGDAFFQQKCMRFLRGFQANKGTVLFVSHDTSAVIGLCDHAILLEAGSVKHFGNAESVSTLYLEQLYSDRSRGQNQILDSAATESKGVANLPSDNACVVQQQMRVIEGDMRQETRYLVAGFRPNAERFGDGGATIIDAGFLDRDGRSISTIKGGQHVGFFIRVAIHKTVKLPAFGFMIKNNLGEFVFTEGTDAHFKQQDLLFCEGDEATATFNFLMPHLNKGRYMVNVAFAEGIGDEHIQHCWMHDAIQLDVIESRLAHGYCGMNETVMKIEVVSPRVE